MNELVVIKKAVIGTEEVNSVDARELQEFLGSGQKFADWIKVKVIENLFFSENTDFVVFRNLEKNPEGDRPRVDYALTIDTAKKVAMAEQTYRGNEVRDYFIACEKKLKEVITLPSNITNRQVIALDVKALQDIANIFGVPEHLAQVEIVKDIRKDYGVDLSNYLLQAPAQNNIKDEDMFLEPEDLGKLFRITAQDMNKRLRDLGLQYKEDGRWCPTEKGKRYCAKHQWSTQYKSGYNWKWNVKAVKQTMKEI